MLSQDNIMRFINIETCKLLFDIGSKEEGISTAAISSNGRYIAAVMENGSLNLYSVRALTQEGSKVECFIFLKTAVNPIKVDTCLYNFCIRSSLRMCWSAIFNTTYKEKVVCRVSVIVTPACQVI